MSEWYRVDNPQEMDTFRGILKKGDMVQMKYGEFYYWAVCTQVGHKPKMVHRYKIHHHYREGIVHKAGFDPEEGSVLEISLDELRKEISICINNSRDKITPPKQVDDIVNYALEAVSMEDSGQLGQYGYEWNNDLEFAERVRYPKDALDKRLDDRSCSPWHTEEGYESFSWLLRPGDMVEFNRKNVYSHWAVVVSSPLRSELHWPLVHRYGSGDAAELVKKLIGTIMLSPFQEVIKGSRFRINNSRDKMHTPKDVANIRMFALRSVGSNAFGKYNLASNNCWHFAMQARYRVKVQWSMNRHKLFESVRAIRQFLSAGDIIQYSECDSLAAPHDQIGELAIYVERAKPSGLFASKITTDKTQEVAYLSRLKGHPGKAVVSLISADDFFSQVALGKNFYINNRWDRMWKPKHSKDIVKYIVDAIGKEDPYFVVNARYGKKATEEVRGIGGEVSTAMAELGDQWIINTFRE